MFDKQELKWLADRKFDKRFDVSQVRNHEFDLPLVNAKNGNNGIMYYGRSCDFDFVDGGIDIINDGAISTGNVYPQPHRIGVLYNAYVITLKNGDLRQEILEYLSCILGKTIKGRFSYDNKATWNKVKDLSISLPITPSGDIDFDYMESYIKAIEKLVIADVVDYKDSIIETTKKVVSNEGMMKDFNSSFSGSFNGSTTKETTQEKK